MSTNLQFSYAPFEFETLPAQFQAVMESLNEGVAIADNSGFIRYVNRGFIEITGFTESEILGKRTYEVYFPVGSKEFLAESELMLKRWEDRRKGVPDVYETEIVRKDRKKRWIETRAASLFSEDGLIVGSIGAISDITQKKLLEEELIWSQKMEVVGRLAGGLAHDFNNLLTVIQGYTEIITTELGSDHPSQRKLQMVRAASDSAALLTQQLLSLSKKEVFNFQQIDLNQIIEDSLGMIKGLVGEKVKITTNISKNLPQIKGDSSHFQRILLNLAVNARDAMPDGGSLSFSTCLVNNLGEEILEKNNYIPNSFVELRVFDTGIGMEEAVRSKIFEPFFSTKKQNGGSGIGLTVTYNIVKQHGGYIRIESSPGKGSKFYIRFPAVAIKSEKILKNSLDKGTNRGDEVILVVEDNPEIRELLSDSLMSHGYHVLVASNSESAIEMIQKNKGLKIDLLITDLVMSGMNGLKLIEWIKVCSPRTKSIVISGCPKEHDEKLSLESSNLPFLNKPFYPEALISLVREVLDSNEKNQDIL